MENNTINKPMSNNKQTAVEWLVEKLDQNFDYVADTIIEQAKEMEKQQMVFAQMDMFNHINKDEFGLDYLNKRNAAEEFAEQYYNKEYAKTTNN